MADMTPIQRGFTKQAQLHGLTLSQANQLFKQANGLGQIGQGLQQMGQKGMDMFRDFRSQNPAAVDAGVGGLIGAGAGALIGGKGNRGVGAMTGGALGAGVGGLGMHPEVVQQFQQQIDGRTPEERQARDFQSFLHRLSPPQQQQGQPGFSGPSQ